MDEDSDFALREYVPGLTAEIQMREFIREQQDELSRAMQEGTVREYRGSEVREVVRQDTTDHQSNAEKKQQAQQLLDNIALDNLNKDKPMSFDDSFSVQLGRSAELRTQPVFLKHDGIPIATKGDFALIKYRRAVVAIKAAVNIASEADAKEFLDTIGLRPLIEALTSPSPAFSQYRVDIVKGMCRLMRKQLSVASELAGDAAVINVFSEMIETPLKGVKRFQGNVDKERELKAQHEAVAIVQRMVRSSDAAVELLQKDTRLKRALLQVSQVSEGEVVKYRAPLTIIDQKDKRKNEKKVGQPVIVDFPHLKTAEMARVAAWGLGGVPWKPRVPGQRGLRILSFDGGGTRGVLSVAMLKELLVRVGNVHAHEMFDVICGTSTGGIIAMLLGVKLRDVHEVRILKFCIT